MSAMESNRQSLFAYKGWNRLVVTLSIAYICVIAFLIAYEHYTINPFDQFDKTSHRYNFWVWSPVEVLPASEHHLRLRIGFIAALVTLPPLALAGAVYSTLWVYRGF